MADAFNHNGWQVICHGERLSVAQHGKFTQGCVLSRTALAHSALDKGRLEELRSPIAIVCCFGELDCATIRLEYRCAPQESPAHA